LPRQLLKNGPARRIGQGAEHVIGMGCWHIKTITKWLCVVKENVKIFELPGDSSPSLARN
jgi:hypothetical protein